MYPDKNTTSYRTEKQLNIHMMTIKNPFITTTRGLNIKPGANVRPIVRRIQSKIYAFGICSPEEEQFLQRYTDFGKILKKDPL
jgi:hypothetical protein